MDGAQRRFQNKKNNMQQTAAPNVDTISALFSATIGRQYI
jgi:hypothetical protein